jgi:anti-anti-sigma regulatory factor
VTDQAGVFEVLQADLGAAPGLAVRGNVDVAAVPPLEEALEAAIKTTIGAFVIDLSVEFLDRSDLLAVLHARGPLARDQRALAVVFPPGRVRQLFEVGGAAEPFFLYDSREDVDAALVPAR